MNRFDLILVGIAVAALLLLAYRQLFGSSTVAAADEPALEVGKLIERVRNDLMDAEQRRIREGRPSMFAVKSFDLEINFVVRKTSETTAGANFEVVTLGAGESTGNETVQKIQLHMESLEAPAESTLVRSAIKPGADTGAPTSGAGGAQ